MERAIVSHFYQYFTIFCLFQYFVIKKKKKLLWFEYTQLYKERK